jgi:hypothetical protein
MLLQSNSMRSAATSTFAANTMTNQQISDLLCLKHNDLLPSEATAGHIALCIPGEEADAAARRHGYENQAGARRHFVFQAGGK